MGFQKLALRVWSRALGERGGHPFPGDSRQSALPFGEDEPEARPTSQTTQLLGGTGKQEREMLPEPGLWGGHRLDSFHGPDPTCQDSRNIQSTGLKMIICVLIFRNVPVLFH